MLAKVFMVQTHAAFWPVFVSAICFHSVLFLKLCGILLGFPRNLASTEQRKESRTPKALMLRNKHVNTIFLCLGVSWGLRTCCFFFFFSWKSRPWFLALNCSSSLLARAKLKDFSWLQIKDCKMYCCSCSVCFFCCFFPETCGQQTETLCQTDTGFYVHYTYCIIIHKNVINTVCFNISSILKTNMVILYL